MKPYFACDVKETKNRLITRGYKNLSHNERVLFFLLIEKNKVKTKDAGIDFESVLVTGGLVKAVGRYFVLTDTGKDMVVGKMTKFLPLRKKVVLEEEMIY